MQKIIIEKPYEFIPPYESRFWRPIVEMYLPRAARLKHGIVETELRGVEHLQESLAAGHGILLTPNHCRPADPFVMGLLSKAVGSPFFFVASWHAFMQSWLQTFLLRRMGAFSIYREGMDKSAINTSVDILVESRRPLVIFPEGVITRTNDVLVSLMEGPSFIARRAAKKKANSAADKKVVVHPVAIRYLYRGDIKQAVDPLLTEIESRLTWRPQRSLPLYERLAKVGSALLGLKEVEYMEVPFQGDIHERLERLIDRLLIPKEEEWLDGKREPNVVARVKKLRIAMLPDMIAGGIGDEERERRWQQLADLYLAQQLSCYAPNYVKSHPSVDRFLETVERFEEDITDDVRVHNPMKCIVEVDESYEVSPERVSRGEPDPVMTHIEQRLQTMLTTLSQESAMVAE